MPYQATLTQHGNIRRPQVRRRVGATGLPLRRRQPTAYLIASRGQGSMSGLAEAVSSNGLVFRRRQPTAFLIASRGRGVRGLGFAPAVGAGAAGGPVGIAVALGISAGIMGVTALIGKLGKAGKQKQAASQVVEETARLMNQNLQEFRQAPQVVSNQTAALQNFEDLWAYLVQNCGSGQLGSAGRRCVDERKAGSTATCWVLGREGTCDFFKLFREPIAQASVGADPSFVSSLTGGGEGSGTYAPLLGLAAVGLLLYSVAN